MAKLPWVDLNLNRFELIIASFNETPADSALVIRGDGPLPQETVNALAFYGFSKIEGPRTVWARPGDSIKISELKTAFPDLKRKDLPSSDFRKRFRGASPFHRTDPIIAPIKTDQFTSSHSVPPAQAPADHGERKDNSFQAVYWPASKLGNPIAMIPVNMKKPTVVALKRIEDRYGPIDDFVANELGYDLRKLETVLSPEQIDAVGMASAASDRDREMILADQTGLGKGRVLAATMLAAARKGKTVIFITEKANLFSDIYRDLIDIDGVEALGKPFLLNDGSKIIDLTSVNGDVLYESLKDSEIRKIIKSKKLPDGCRFLMCTYSQFNRLGSAKEKFLEAVAEGAYVVVDEAHNAAGADSNTSKSLDVGLSGAWGVIRSSATFARDGEALLKYPRVLPPSLRDEDVRIALQAGGNSMAESVAQYLAEDGVLIRREHDLSAIKIEVVVDDERKDQSMSYSDALAPILSKLAHLQRMVDDEIDIRNEEAQKEGGKAAKEVWYTANFGSRRAPLLRQFLTALSVDFCIDRCVQSLILGEKPVVVIEQTMESLMRELAGLSTAEPDPDAELTEDQQDQLNALQGTQAPDFRSALSLMMDRILHMSVRRGKDDPEKVKVEDPYILQEAESIASMIANFPKLSLSPIDDIRDRIEAISHQYVKEGKIEKPWKTDEISARNLKVQDGVYTPMKKANRNDIIVAFNSGSVDAVVITRAASTGLSLHASEKAKDQRRRRMIELQIPANVVERVQFWGRVNRRGQVNVPAFETLSTGLPSQMRSLAMNNRKVEKLSATVSANASTATAMDVPDMIDSIGNQVALRILSDEPRIAERMFIAMRNIDPEMAEQELYYINKFLQGFPYLMSSESEPLFQRLLKEYNDAVDGLVAQGKTPRGVRELDGQWTEVSREPYEDAISGDGPVFGRPVELVVMEGMVEKTPLTGDRVQRAISEARERLSESSGKPAGPYFESAIKQISRNTRTVLNASLSGRYISVDAALKDKEPNAVKTAKERLTKLTELLGMLAPGMLIEVPGPDDDRKSGYIVDVRLRDPDLAHMPGEWSVRYAVPGDSSITEISIATLMRDKGYRLYPDTRHSFQPDFSRFDRAPSGLVPEYKHFLDGNLVRSMLIATEISAGSMVSYYDASGERQRSVLISARGQKALEDRKARITNSQDAVSYVNSGISVFSNYRERTQGLMVSRDDYGLVMSVPKSKEWERVLNSDVTRYAGSFKTDKTGKLCARIDPSKLQSLFDALIGTGVHLYFDNRTIKARQNRFSAPKQPKFGNPMSSRI